MKVYFLMKRRGRARTRRKIQNISNCMNKKITFLTRRKRRINDI